MLQFRTTAIYFFGGFIASAITQQPVKNAPVYKQIGIYALIEALESVKQINTRAKHITLIILAKSKYILNLLKFFV